MWIYKLPFLLLGTGTALYALCYAYYVMHPAKGRGRTKENKKAAAGAWLLAAADLVFTIVFFVFI